MIVPARSQPAVALKCKQHECSLLAYLFVGLPLQDICKTFAVSDAVSGARLAEAAVATQALTTISPATVLRYIAHELRLQFVGAAFTTNVHGTFPHRQFFVPRREMHYRHLVISKRT